MKDWRVVIRLGAVGSVDDRQILTGTVLLRRGSGPGNTEIDIKISVPYDPQESLQSTRVAVAKQAISALHEAYLDLPEARPQELEELDLESIVPFSASLSNPGT